LRDHGGEIRDHGGDLAVIGTGGQRYAAEFVAEERLDFPVLIDPDLVSYQAVGAGQGGAATFLRPRQAARAASVVAGGKRQHRAGKHTMQLGATHVIAPDGGVPYAWVSDDFADHAPLEEVIAAVAGRPAA
jgi:peroxiredoxin